MSVPNAPLSPADVTGALTGPAGAAVHARVRLAPPPQITPAALAGWLVEVRDSGGALRDYALDHTALFTAGTDAARSAPAVFRAWRATWLAEAELGELGAVRAFTATAQRQATDAGAPLAVLPRLDWADDVVDPASALVLGEEVETTRQRLRATPARGLGLLDVARRGFVRTVPPVGGEVTLLAAAGDRVLTAGGGLLLHTGGRTWELTGWTVTGRGLVADTTDGPVPLTGAPAERLLTWLAPGAVHVAVRPVPLTTVWAHAVTGLAETCARAARTGRPVELHVALP